MISISSMAIPNVSFSSPSSSHSWNHDVFLSFRGEDTRNTFIGHLHHALIEKGIKTFIDEVDLQKGDEISATLLEAIQQSKISIIIFYKNYATSTWCLDELVKILEYVRKQFGEVMDMHEKKFKDNMQRVLKWKVALKEAANLSGWHLNNGHESDFIRSIVEEISSRILMKCTFLDVAKNPVGLHYHIHSMHKLLSVGYDDVRMVGIHGIGGIGKTTVAKAVYNLFANQFQSCSFLANIGEAANRCGLVQLQETLLSETLGNTNLKVGIEDRGINVIKEMLCHKKVRLVLDDVNKLKQLEKLVGDKNWFGPGSRIIITTRDQHVLDTHGVERKYEVQGLSHADALQLLSWNAFKKSYPERGYEKLMDHVVQYASGLPLALMHDLIQLMGRNIVHKESPNEPGKRSRLWSCEDILHVLVENTGTNAIEGIKLDLLGKKDILLNPRAFTKMKRLRLLIIRNACFSEGPKSLPNELRFLDWAGYPSTSLPSNFHPQKLITLNMCHSKIKQFQGIKVCENLRKVNFSYCEYLMCTPDVSMMANLESLDLRGCCNLVEVHQSVGFLKKLSLLNVEYCSKLRLLPNLKLPRLQLLGLSSGTSIEKFPNIVGEIPDLSSIWIYNSPIQELPSSVEYLIGLERITIILCENLRDLPISISKLPHLKYLNLSDCKIFGKFPKSSSSSSSTNSGWLASSKWNKTQDIRLSVGFRALEKLIISNCDLAKVDFLESLHCLSILQHLDLSGNNFVSIPACIFRFTHLQSLKLIDCEGLRQMNASSGGKSFIDNLTMMIPMLYRFCEKMRTTIRIRGGELPAWFIHKSRENYMCFRVPPPKRAKLAGLVIGIVFKQDDHFGPSHFCASTTRVCINGIFVEYLEYYTPGGFFESDCVWLYCVPRGAFNRWDENNEGDHFDVSFEFQFKDPILDVDNNIFGVHFIFKQNDNMDDDDDDLRSMQEIKDEEKALKA
ncbi:hypothetical protein I3760_09G111100 [Carya illinoinensis]|nr:hypothetical protein I3760_09G111100 [Carya illinoinensis]